MVGRKTNNELKIVIDERWRFNATTQEMEGSEYAQKILAVLYATEDGFAVPDDEEIPPPPEDDEY